MTLPTAIVERIDDLIHAATRDGYFQGREAEYRAAVESDRAALTEAIAAALAPGEAVAWLVLDRNGHRVNVTLRDPSSGPHADGFTLVPLAPAAPAPVLTVGAALALPEVQRGEAVVEWHEDGEWWQAKVEREAAPRARMLFEWEKRPKWQTRWSYVVWGVALALPCRLVPIAEADADPSTRGPLPPTETMP